MSSGRPVRSPPAFYYDVFSPYAYMAAERIDRVMPEADWRPIEVFALFKLNGRTSWVFSEERTARMREIEQRAAHYGLPPIRWPDRFPADLHGLATAATVARQEQRERAFSLGVWRAVYVRGVDASAPQELRRIAEEAELDPDDVLRRMRRPEVEDELRARIDEAHQLGVPGVPTVVVDGEVFWGDDRLTDAAEAAAGR